MELHHIRAFLAVADELHFGRAAQRLHMAQPPLSRTIRQLERSLGTRLFERTTRTVRLTPQGEALLGPAQEIVRAFDAAERAVRQAGEGETGRVRIGFAGPSSHDLITDLARAVRRDHPGIELALTSITYGTDAVGQLLADSLDLAIVRLGPVPPGLAARVVRRERLVVVVPVGHWLAGRHDVAMADLAEEGWVTLSASSGSLVRATLLERAHGAGFVPRIVQQAADTWTIMALVGAGVGITLSVDSAFASLDADRVVIVPLAGPDPHIEASLAWRAGDASPALRRVVDLAGRLFPAEPPAAD